MTKHSGLPLGNPFVQILRASTAKDLNFIVAAVPCSADVVDDHPGELGDLAGLCCVVELETNDNHSFFLQYKALSKDHPSSGLNSR